MGNQIIIMTNAAKEYEAIKNSLYRKSYYSFLKMGRDIVEFHLESSLELDGRFYGAEWFEEYSHFKELEGILAPYFKGRYVDPVEEVRQVRDANIYEQWDD